MTTGSYPVRVDEHNGLLHAYCPTCSRMYLVEDTDRKPVELPAKCSRCGGPMDDQKALAFGEEQAKAYGKPPSARGAALTQPPSDRMVRSAANR